MLRIRFPARHTYAISAIRSCEATLRRKCPTISLAFVLRRMAASLSGTSPAGKASRASSVGEPSMMSSTWTGGACLALNHSSTVHSSTTESARPSTQPTRFLVSDIRQQPTLTCKITDRVAICTTEYTEHFYDYTSTSLTQRLLNIPHPAKPVL